MLPPSPRVCKAPAEGREETRMEMTIPSLIRVQSRLFAVYHL